MYRADNYAFIIGADTSGGSRTIGLVDEYAVYNLSSLDQTAYDAKLASIASHYSAMGEVPEPGTLALLVIGLLGFIAYVWRKRRS